MDRKVAERPKSTSAASSKSSLRSPKLDPKKDEPAEESKEKKKVSTTVIQQNFGKLMDSMGIPPRTPQRTQMEALSWKEKNRMIKEWKSTGPKLDSEILNFIDEFKRKTMNIEELELLRDTLADETPEWVQLFVRSNGVLWLFECLTFHLYKYGTIRGDPNDLDLLEVLIECLREMLNNGMSGLKEVIAIPYSFFQLIDSLSYVDNIIKADVLELLSAILLISPTIEEDCWSLITSALQNYKSLKLPDFLALLEEIEMGEDVTVKVAFMTFINTMIVQGDSLANRVKVRQLVMDEGIIEILNHLRAAFKDEDELQEQIKVFDEELESDGKELKSLTSGRKTAQDESADMAINISSKVKGTPMENIFNNVLRALLRMNLNTHTDETLSKKFWNHILKFVQQFDLTGTTGVTYEQLAKNLTNPVSAAQPAAPLVPVGNPAKEKALTDEITTLKAEIESLKTRLEAAASGAPIPPADPAANPDAPPDFSAAPPPPGMEDFSGAPPPPGMDDFSGAPPPPGFEGPPPPGMGGPPPPGGGPPPPGGFGGPPPPGGGPPGSKSRHQSFKDPDRPAMLPWRWEKLNQFEVKGTVFDGLAESSLALVTQNKIQATDMEVNFSIKKVNTALAAQAAKQAAENGGGETGPAGKKKNPTVLTDGNRLNMILIIMHRFKEPVDSILKSILEINTRFLTLQKLTELKGLFPGKAYKEEEEKFVKFQQENKDPNILVEAERIMYELFTKIPRVHDKIYALAFCFEAEEKLEECLDNARTVKAAFTELHSKRIRDLLEVALAMGNYINNPPDQTKGFKVGSLLKLNDVVSKSKSKYTLMHHLADIVEAYFKDLLNFPDELTHLQEAHAAVENLAVTIADIKSEFKVLQDELKASEENGETRWIQFLKEYADKFTAMITEVGTLQEYFGQEAKYFGESNASDLGAFFASWDKFSSSFQTAVKYNITVKRKEEALAKKQKALERKEELLRKKKEKKKAMLKKAMLKKKKEALEGGSPSSDSPTSGTNKDKGAAPTKGTKDLNSSGKAVSKTGSKGESSPKSGVASKAPGKPGLLKKTTRKEEGSAIGATAIDVDGVVGELLGNGSMVQGRGARGDRKGGEDRGAVKQLVLSLRTSSKFDKLRGSRIQIPEKSGGEELTLATEQSLVKQVSSRLPKYTAEDLANL
eukprot:TRINITY_DN3619_c1_g2_i1.p1 TRINITY_DN3619_c1_g2~~TRINITY_DN3619_c1_g2_i1.p1  ORF type:complete len:1167 (-),score=385.36 TRINITY_DN3619_c1_g2_i1:125-3625(-)